ncbi:unnamed protein product [Leuciscus chuanchicus]
MELVKIESELKKRETELKKAGGMNPLKHNSNESDTPNNENEKTISQSSALGGEETEQDEETERKRKSDGDEERADESFKIKAGPSTGSDEKLRLLVLGDDDALMDEACGTILGERQSREGFKFGILEPRTAQVCGRQILRKTSPEPQEKMGAANSSEREKEHLRKAAMEMDKRSKEMDKRAEELDKREKDLDIREKELDKRVKELKKRETELKKGETELKKAGGTDLLKRNRKESEAPNMARKWEEDLCNEYTDDDWQEAIKCVRSTFTCNRLRETQH